MKLTLLTYNACGLCFSLKKRLEKHELVVDTLQYTDSEYPSFSKKHGVELLPTLIVEDGESVEKITSNDDIFDFIKNHINMSL
jgi:hypothetical protein